MSVSSASPGRPPRGGMTLLEVLLALTIFLLSLVAIGRLITLGTDRARDVQGRAVQLCQSKLAEVVLGDPATQSGSGQFDEDSNWQWTVDQEDSGIPGLSQVTVTVRRKNAENSQPAAVLTQMVFDPTQRGSTLDPDPTLAAANPADTGSSSSSSSGSSSPSGGAAGGGGGMAKPASGSAPASGSGPKPASGPAPASPAKGGKS